MMRLISISFQNHRSVLMPSTLKMAPTVILSAQRLDSPTTMTIAVGKRVTKDAVDFLTSKIFLSLYFMI